MKLTLSLFLGVRPFIDFRHLIFCFILLVSTIMDIITTSRKKTASKHLMEKCLTVDSIFIERGADGEKQIGRKEEIEKTNIIEKTMKKGNMLKYYP